MRHPSLDVEPALRERAGPAREGAALPVDADDKAAGVGLDRRKASVVPMKERGTVRFDPAGWGRKHGRMLWSQYRLGCDCPSMRDSENPDTVAGRSLTARQLRPRQAGSMTYQQILDALRKAAQAGDRKAEWMLRLLRQVRD